MICMFGDLTSICGAFILLLICTNIQVVSGDDDIDKPDACANNPCKNGGTCEKSLVYPYKCKCKDGFTGVTCANIANCVPYDVTSATANTSTCNVCQEKQADGCKTCRVDDFKSTVYCRPDDLHCVGCSPAKHCVALSVYAVGYAMKYDDGSCYFFENENDTHIGCLIGKKKEKTCEKCLLNHYCLDPAHNNCTSIPFCDQCDSGTGKCTSCMNDNCFYNGTCHHNAYCDGTACNDAGGCNSCVNGSCLLNEGLDTAICVIPGGFYVLVDPPGGNDTEAADHPIGNGTAKCVDTRPVYDSARLRGNAGMLRPNTPLVVTCFLLPIIWVRCLLF